MDLNLEKLISSAHKFLEFMTTYYSDQDKLNNSLILEGINGNAFSEDFKTKLIKRDLSFTDTPYHVSEELIKDIAVNDKNIQKMIDCVEIFKIYDPKIFSYCGSFISVMMNKYLENNGELFIDTMNNSQVHVPDYYFIFGRESSYPWDSLEKLEEYNKDNLLISNLGSRLKKGKVKIKGNVGNFFAFQNKGNIELNGECGWRPCYEILGGIVTINGTAGHGLADYAHNGKIFVNGNIRSVGDYYTTAFYHEIFLNGVKLPKKDVGHAGPIEHLLN